MDMPAEDAQELQQLEGLLLDPAFRARRERVAGLLAEDFCEFGRSGRVYDKEEVLRAMRAKEGAGTGEGGGDRLVATGFRVRALAVDVALVTYRAQTESGERAALRSSIWRRVGSGWEMVFHQGTAIGG